MAFGKTNGVDYQKNDLLTLPTITGFSYDDQTAFDAAVDNANENEIRVTPCEEDPLCLCELSRHWAWVTYGIDCSDQRVMYWYHPDYLGNTEFITDLNGDPYQFFLYSPWGESLESHHKHSNQMAFAYDSPYRFNAKELDAETGNYYYGARYYDPKVSVWLSVDPLAGNFTHLTPYNFLEGNPINLIDPDGRGSVTPHYWNLDGEYLGKIGSSDDMRSIDMTKDEFNSAKKTLEGMIKIDSESRAVTFFDNGITLDEIYKRNDDGEASTHIIFDARAAMVYYQIVKGIISKDPLGDNWRTQPYSHGHETDIGDAPYKLIIGSVHRHTGKLGGVTMETDAHETMDGESDEATARIVGFPLYAVDLIQVSRVTPKGVKSTGLPLDYNVRQDALKFYSKKQE